MTFATTRVKLPRAARCRASAVHVEVVRDADGSPRQHDRAVLGALLALPDLVGDPARQPGDPADRLTWSVVTACAARKHGDFDNDRDMLATLKGIVAS